MVVVEEKSVGCILWGLWMYTKFLYDLELQLIIIFIIDLID